MTSVKEERGEWKPYPLLAGVQNDGAIVEINMKVSQSLKIE